jgi:hypothetical protein
MTGNEIAKMIAKHKGPVCIGAVMKNDVAYIRAVKSDLIDYFKRIGNINAESEFHVTDGVGYVNPD